MAVTQTVTRTLNDIPPAIAAYAIATHQPIDVTVKPFDDGQSWDVCLYLPFDKQHDTLSATAPFHYSFDGQWSWLNCDLDTANDMVRAFIADQEARYPGLVLAGP